MILSVGFCVIIVATCAAVLAETQTQVGNNQDDGKHVISDLTGLASFEEELKLLEHRIEKSGYDAAVRKKRSSAALAAFLIQKGINAVKYLTKEAYEIPSKHLSSNPSDVMARQFVKPGNYDRAFLDFTAIKPVYKKDFTMPEGIYGKAGNVGDRLIYVKRSHEVTEFKMILYVGFCVLFVAMCAALLAETQIQVGNNQDGSQHDTSSEHTMFTDIASTRSACQISPQVKLLKSLGYGAAIRKKRACSGLATLLIRKGIKAVKSLTRGAEEIPSKHLSYNPSGKRQFVKKGSYSHAVRDFYAVNPVDTRDFTTPVGIYGKAGNVGDRLIYVKSSHEVTGKPTVEILQMGDLQNIDRAKLRLTDIITYTD